MRYFNTEGLCRQDEHYMVRLDDRLEKIKRLYVDRKKYFVINKGRQYGKTTTLKALAEYLKDDYIVISMDFQGIGTEEFVNAQTFANAFASEFLDAAAKTGVDRTEDVLHPLTEFVEHTADKSLRELFVRLSMICKTSEKPIVLMIDEVDSASNNQVFIDFLAQLRKYYLNRENSPIFQSVVLAGVYDIKNLKLKIRPDSEHQYNSPWNIAAEFKIDMSFSPRQIAAMLKEYEAEHQTGMDTGAVAQEIYQYTSGYPYLVSAICKYLDEELPDREGLESGTRKELENGIQKEFGSGARKRFENKFENGFESRSENENGNENIAGVWTAEGIAEAVKNLLNENIPLFGSMVRHINEYQDLKKMLYAMLFQGERVAYNPDNRIIELACMFGYVVNVDGIVSVANRIFETRLYNLFLSEEELASTMSRMAKQDKNQFILNGRLNMERVLEKFVEYFHDIYGDNDEKFIEEHGRKFFLLYLKPIINGSGNYYIEAQTRDAKRTDVIMDYKGEQYIIELKIWHGNEYNERGEKQLAEYLDYYHKEKGYMLSFNFNKKKERGIKEIKVGGKTMIEAVV